MSFYYFAEQFKRSISNRGSKFLFLQYKQHI